VTSAMTLLGGCLVLAFAPMFDGAHAGAEHTLTISPRLHWFDTGINVKAGDSLVFHARGHWWDFYERCSADGYSASLLYGLGLRPRVIDGDRFFRLLGRIGDSSGPPSTDTPELPQGPDATFVIGADSSFTALRGGRLYVFANDMTHMYWNNWGAIQLQVSHRAQ
jgi:hypothetical protein